MGYEQGMDEEQALYRIPPFHYIHVLDETTNVTRVELGPQTFIRKSNERVILHPTKMIVIPPRHYCIVKNPVARNEAKELILDNYGQVRLHHADEEVRLVQDPFSLYPGEELCCSVQPLQVIPAQKALKLHVLNDFYDGDVHRVAGDAYLFKGPGTYIPRKDVEVIDTLDSIIIKSNEALKLKAIYETTDKSGLKRVAGEEWMIRDSGAYLPGVYEEVVAIVKAQILTEKTAIHVRALKSFQDQTGQNRKNGEEYLITLKELESFIPDVYEEFVDVVHITTLTSRQYTVILNPYLNGKPQLGHRKVIRGEVSFFLQPGEMLERCILDVHILSEDEGIVLKAEEAYVDISVEPHITRKPGDRWMLKGPMEYIPTAEVTIEDIRKAIPLHQNEGIYVRNIKTGSVRAVIGKTYMLAEDEEKWVKNLSPSIKTLLSKNRDVTADRGDWANSKENENENEMDMTNVVSFQVPHNSAVQIYDYKDRSSRVIFGPDLVLLGPNEEFTQISLSGGKPKKPNLIRSLALLLGPDFCTDTVIVETADHARLQLQVAYNWHFKVLDDSSHLFTVPDFIGDMCKTIASKIRGSVSSVTFDDFHKNSATIIRTSVFGLDENKQAKTFLRFESNNLHVTSIDIQSVEPIDQRTRDSLQKSVTLAIEITTQSQEATAKREAERIDQEAKGRLERQRILDEAEAEKARKLLLELQAECSAVECTGHAKAEAISRIEAIRIEAEAAVEAAKLKTEALMIESNAELERLSKARKNEIDFINETNKLEIIKASEMSNIEIMKFQKMVESIGADTLQTMASAPQDHQIKMMQSLGLHSTLITDGRTPINLLNTAQGLIGAQNQ